MGTGAADWNIDRRQGTAFFRRFSSALADDKLVIDPGPYIYDFARLSGMPHLFDNVTETVITHSHGDHMNADSIKRLSCGKEFTVYCDGAVADKLIASGVSNVEYVRLTPFEPVVTRAGYEIIPCRSNHGPYLAGENTFNYIIGRDGRSFFYGLDSGWIMYDTWLCIKKRRPNAVIFECTLGDCPGDDRMFGHTSISMIEIMLQTMRTQHGPADDAAYYTSHMARTLHGTHEELRERLAPLGVTPAYDGMRIVI